MAKSEIQHLLKKSARSLEDHEVLEVLDHEIEERGRRPTRRELDQGEWNISRTPLKRAADTLNNALWMLGREYKERLTVGDKEVGKEQSFDEKTELVQHELRGYEHEHGVPPSSAEAGEITKHYNEIMDEAGIPYRQLSSRKGIIHPEREDELVEMLFVDYKDPSALLHRNSNLNHRDFDSDEKAGKYEIELVMEAYMPWIDEYRE